METNKTKWAYKIKRDGKNIPGIGWYKCPKCGVEFQDTPPTYTSDGNWNKLCPDCGGSYIDLPEGMGISKDGLTQSLKTIKENERLDTALEAWQYLPWYKKMFTNIEKWTRDFKI